MAMESFDIAAMVERIHSDHIHGASWLAREAARDLALVANAGGGSPGDRLATTHALARDLALARPSMAAIAMTVAHVWEATTELLGDPLAQLAALRNEALAVEKRWQLAVEVMTEWVRGILTTAEGAVYTLSRSHTVEGVLIAVARDRAHTTPLRMIVSESRPGSEGVALAHALVEAGAVVTLASDAACASLMEEAALVIVGADAIRADGSLVNKVGTRSLALTAHALGKPVYALAESFKVVAPTYPVDLLESAPTSLLAQPIIGLKERNPLFDITPASLITAVVSEKGVMDLTAIARQAELAEKAYFALMSTE